MFSPVEVSRDRHEHGSCRSPSCTEEKGEKVKERDGRQILVEEQKKDSQGEADPSEGKRDLPPHSIGEPSPEESKKSRENTRPGKEGGSRHLIHPQVHQIPHMVDDDNDVDAKDGKAGKEEKRPEPAPFHLFDEPPFFLTKG